MKTCIYGKEKLTYTFFLKNYCVAKHVPYVENIFIENCIYFKMRKKCKYIRGMYLVVSPCFTYSIYVNTYI